LRDPCASLASSVLLVSAFSSRFVRRNKFVQDARTEYSELDVEAKDKDSTKKR
jgi:hypothetical protein